MRRKSNARNLFWPTLAAIAVILVLLSASQLQDWLGLEKGVPPLTASHHQTSDVVPSPLPPPTPISSSDAATRKIAHDLASPQDSRATDVERKLDLAVDTHAMLETPDSLGPTVILLAPVMDDDQELAGLTTSADLPTGSFASSGTSSSNSVNAQTVSAMNTADSIFVNADSTNTSELHRSEDETGSTEQLRSISDLNASANEANNYLLGGDGRALPTGSSLAEESPSLSLSIPGNDIDNTQNQNSGDLATNALAENAEGKTLDSKPAGVAWPRTPALETDLKQLQELATNRNENTTADNELIQWIQSVRVTLLDLQSIPSITDSRAAAVIAHLRTLADQGIAYGETRIEDRALQAKTLRTAHALLRRTIIWNAVSSVGENSTGQVVSLRIRDIDSPLPAVETLKVRVAETGDAEGWSRFLLLSEISDAAFKLDATARRLVAQRLLSRVTWDGLSESHRTWLDDDSVRLLTSRVRPWADAPVDYAALLAQLERQEADALDMGGIDVATAVQNLRFSENPQAANVAKAINDYYRNANLRMAVSADLLRQLLPDVPEKTTAVRQTLVGMPVRGTGIVNSQLGLELIPTQGAWNLQLSTDGLINSRTAASQGPVRITNRSQSRFAAATPIRIDNHNLIIGDTVASVTSRVKLESMKTQYDGFPVIESLVRAIAMSRYEQTSPIARRQSESLTERQISDEISGEVETEINKASDQLASRLLGPLGRLQLDPLVVDLDTTEDRLSTRYRVAGEWQLAAFTPRPRALSNSVLSMQIHQSLLNNTFEQLLPSDSPQPIRETMGRVLEMFGADPSRLPGELPENVHIRFASTRPVTVEIEDGLLWLTLRVVRLHDDAGLDLNYFVVRAAFRPEFDGLNARLVRDGVIQISGPRLGIRERLPVRAIFTKVLADERPLPLVSPELAQHPAAQGLKVGMLELVDGWLCLAICPDEQAITAEKTAAVSDQRSTR